MISGLLNMTKQVITKEITWKQAYYQLKMRLFNSQSNLQDDFDWTKYHSYYEQELISVARKNTLLPDAKDFKYENQKIIQVNPDVNPLHTNHHILYELILNLNPTSVLETGCGAGDHLRNIHHFNNNIELFGIDRSDEQLAHLKKRHPDLEAETKTVDLTAKDLTLPSVDLVYSQAVLMHISEKEERFQTALRNVFKTAKSHVILIENWSQHDFPKEINQIISENNDWANAQIYKNTNEKTNELVALIVSKSDLPLPLYNK